ncbi:hypothetical protein NECID01_0390 [Nematocida sp. AWRm77]|nr:hypothetical protein NECID01_0390 [Nematocida sp. AWRm77]
MKYLELGCISVIEEDLLRIEEKIPGVNIRMEAYSLKKTRKQKKDSGSGSYKSMSSMVSEALSVAFFGYETQVLPNEISPITEEEFKSAVTNKLFTVGITKSYSEMSRWVDTIFRVLKEAAGEDAGMYSLTTRAGPFEKCFWNECIVLHGKELKRLVLFIILYRNSEESPVM